MKTGRPPLVNWDELFGKNWFTLRRGVHYDSSQSSMAGVIRNNASRRGISVSLVEGLNQFTVTVINGKSNVEPIEA